MAIYSWLVNTPRPKPTASRRRAGYRARLETLEDRAVPSTLTVTSAADSGPGSLRAEITLAAKHATIVFAPGLDGQTIALSSQLTIPTNLTIQGPGAGQLTITGYYSFASNSGIRVFEIDTGVTATLSGLTISNGFVYGAGGGISVDSGATLTVSGCTISNNSADIGGGIYNDGALTVNNSSLTGNQFLAIDGNRGGGGIYNAYGASATINGCTLTGNHGPFNNGTSDDVGYEGDGGAIYNGGAMIVSASTVTDNTPYAFGGGIFEDTYASLSILDKSVVTGNAGGDIFLAWGASPVKISTSKVGTILN